MSYKKYWRVALVFLVVGLLVFGTILTAFALPTTGEGIEPVYLDRNTEPPAQPDPDPEDLDSPGCTLKSVKVDDPVAGNLDEQDPDKVKKSDPDCGFDVEIYDISGNTFSFRNANMPVYHVWVKAGDGGYLFSYPDGIYSDTGLYSPQPDSISHITFYYCEVPLYNICGIKYNDDTEEGIAGWEITLRKLIEIDEVWEVDEDFTPRTVLTADGEDGTTLGQYCFSNLSAGIYRVTEEERENWTNVSELSYELTIPENSEDPPGTTYNRDFSNAPLYNICGMKYDYDSEVDGVYTGLAGWEITLEKLVGESWVVFRTATTADGTEGTILGQYCFAGLRAGTYRVTEETRLGWTNVSDLSYVIEIPVGAEAGSTYGEDFFNRRVEPTCETAWAYDPNKNTPFTELGFGNWGWTNGEYGVGNHELQLWAGVGNNDFDNGTQVGKVTVNYGGSQVTVTYEVYAGYAIQEAHLYIGQGELPVLPHGNPTNAPGQFPYKDYELSDDGKIATFVISDIDFDKFYVAAHAVVCGNFDSGNNENESGEGMPAKHEMTGQEFGDAISEKAKEEPGAVADHVLKEKERDRPDVDELKRERP